MPQFKAFRAQVDAGVLTVALDDLQSDWSHIR
jgi:hypothetical protein